MRPPKLKELFETHKEEILQEVTDRIGRFPWSTYQQFLVHTEEGQRRLRIFVDLFGRALRGEREPFIKALHISEHTVRSHIKNLYRKLGVLSRAHAVAKALGEGIIATEG